MNRKIYLLILGLTMFTGICIAGGFKFGHDKGKQEGYHLGNKDASEQCASFCTSICCASLSELLDTGGQCPINIESGEKQQEEGTAL